MHHMLGMGRSSRSKVLDIRNKDIDPQFHVLNLEEKNLVVGRRMGLEAPILAQEYQGDGTRDRIKKFECDRNGGDWEF